jgi:hypothetical protein
MYYSSEDWRTDVGLSLRLISLSYLVIIGERNITVNLAMCVGDVGWLVTGSAGNSCRCTNLESMKGYRLISDHCSSRKQLFEMNSHVLPPSLRSHVLDCCDLNHRHLEQMSVVHSRGIQGCSVSVVQFKWFALALCVSNV